MCLDLVTFLIAIFAACKYNRHCRQLHVIQASIKRDDTNWSKPARRILKRFPYRKHIMSGPVPLTSFPEEVETTKSWAINIQKTILRGVCVDVFMRHI